MQQRAAEAVVSLRQTLELCRTTGDPFSIALALSFYAAALGAEGDYDTAARSLGEALDLFRQIGCFAQMSRCLVDWGLLAIRHGRLDDAAAALGEGLRISGQLGRVPYRIAQLLAGSAQVAAATRQWSEAARLLVWATQLRARSGAQLPAEREPEERALRDTLLAHIGEDTFAVLDHAADQLEEAHAVELAHVVLERASHQRGGAGLHGGPGHRPGQPVDAPQKRRQEFATSG
jgi:tetratricopeptide (TPR) repeat protein